MAHKKTKSINPTTISAGETNEAKIEDLAERLLRRKYLHGHPTFIRMVLQDIDLHDRKNRDYAFGGRPLGNFERVASLVATYPGLKEHLDTREGVAILYMLKQLDAFLWATAKGHELSEGRPERLRDIDVYTTILRCMLEEEGTK